MKPNAFIVCCAIFLCLQDIAATPYREGSARYQPRNPASLPSIAESPIQDSDEYVHAQNDQPNDQLDIKTRNRPSDDSELSETIDFQPTGQLTTEKSDFNTKEERENFPILNNGRFFSGHGDNLSVRFNKDGNQNADDLIQEQNAEDLVNGKSDPGSYRGRRQRIQNQNRPLRKVTTYSQPIQQSDSKPSVFDVKEKSKLLPTKNNDRPLRTRVDYQSTRINQAKIINADHRKKDLKFSATEQAKLLQRGENKFKNENPYKNNEEEDFDTIPNSESDENVHNFARKSRYLERKQEPLYHTTVKTPRTTNISTMKRITVTQKPANRVQEIGRNKFTAIPLSKEKLKDELKNYDNGESDYSDEDYGDEFDGGEDFSSDTDTKLSYGYSQQNSKLVKNNNFNRKFTPSPQIQIKSTEINARFDRNEPLDKKDRYQTRKDPIINIQRQHLSRLTNEGYIGRNRKPSEGRNVDLDLGLNEKATTPPDIKNNKNEKDTQSDVFHKSIPKQSSKTSISSSGEKDEETPDINFKRRITTNKFNNAQILRNGNSDRNTGRIITQSKSFSNPTASDDPDYNSSWDTNDLIPEVKKQKDNNPIVRRKYSPRTVEPAKISNGQFKRENDMVNMKSSRKQVVTLKSKENKSDDVLEPNKQIPFEKKTELQNNPTSTQNRKQQKTCDEKSDIVKTEPSKRYKVLYPDGHFEFVTNIDQIIKKYPNHKIVNTRDALKRPPVNDDKQKNEFAKQRQDLKKPITQQSQHFDSTDKTVSDAPAQIIKNHTNQKKTSTEISKPINQDSIEKLQIAEKIHDTEVPKAFKRFNDSQKRQIIKKMSALEKSQVSAEPESEIKLQSAVRQRGLEKLPIISDTQSVEKSRSTQTLQKVENNRPVLEKLQVSNDPESIIKLPSIVTQSDLEKIPALEKMQSVELTKGTYKPQNKRKENDNKSNSIVKPELSDTTTKIQEKIVVPVEEQKKSTGIKIEPIDVSHRLSEKDKVKNQLNKSVHTSELPSGPSKNLLNNTLELTPLSPADPKDVLLQALQRLKLIVDKPPEHIQHHFNHRYKRPHHLPPHAARHYFTPTPIFNVTPKSVNDKYYSKEQLRHHSLPQILSDIRTEPLLQKDLATGQNIRSQHFQTDSINTPTKNDLSMNNSQTPLQILSAQDSNVRHDQTKTFIMNSPEEVTPKDKPTNIMKPKIYVPKTDQTNLNTTIEKKVDSQIKPPIIESKPNDSFNVGERRFISDQVDQQQTPFEVKEKKPTHKLETQSLVNNKIATLISSPHLEGLIEPTPHKNRRQNTQEIREQEQTKTRPEGNPTDFNRNSTKSQLNPLNKDSEVEKPKQKHKQEREKTEILDHSSRHLIRPTDQSKNEMNTAVNNKNTTSHTDMEKNKLFRNHNINLGKQINREQKQTNTRPEDKPTDRSYSPTEAVPSLNYKNNEGVIIPNDNIPKQHHVLLTTTQKQMKSDRTIKELTEPSLPHTNRSQITQNQQELEKTEIRLDHISQSRASKLPDSTKTQPNSEIITVNNKSTPLNPDLNKIKLSTNKNKNPKTQNIRDHEQTKTSPEVKPTNLNRSPTKSQIDPNYIDSEGVEPNHEQTHNPTANTPKQDHVLSTTTQKQIQSDLDAENIQTELHRSKSSHIQNNEPHLKFERKPWHDSQASIPITELNSDNIHTTKSNHKLPGTPSDKSITTTIRPISSTARTQEKQEGINDSAVAAHAKPPQNSDSVDTNDEKITEPVMWFNTSDCDVFEKIFTKKPKYSAVYFYDTRARKFVSDESKENDKHDNPFDDFDEFDEYLKNEPANVKPESDVSVGSAIFWFNTSDCGIFDKMFDRKAGFSAILFTDFIPSADDESNDDFEEYSETVTLAP